MIRPTARSGARRGSTAALALTTTFLTLSLLPTLRGQDQPAPAPAAEAKPETAAPEPIALVKFKGVYADLAEQSGDFTALLLGGAGGKPKPFYPMLDDLEELADGEAKRVLFDLSDTFSINAAQLAEVDRVLQKLRKSGKELHAYVENASGAGYQIAALCDEIMIADLGGVDIPSMALGITFMRDAFDLLGVQWDIVRCGDFKGAVEPYVLSSMSSHLRDHYRAMLERMNADAARRIARGRGMSVAKVRELQADRMFTAKQALEAELVDRIVPWRGAEHALTVALGHDDFELEPALAGKKRRKSVNFMQMFSSLLNPKKERDVEDETLVVLHLSGGIVDGRSSVPGSIVSGPVVQTVEKLTANDKVKGVVVRINSPGGSATASEAILLALKELAKVKPVAVSMGTMAASGGYYVTCFGRPIFAEAGTITGSIGVFGMKPCAGALMRRVGLNSELVALDESPTLMSLDRSWTPEQRDRMQTMVNDIYDVFLGHVAASRDMGIADVASIAGGRVWSGEQALDLGLVDRIGGVHDALALVAKEAGLSDDWEVTHVPRPKTFFDMLAEEGVFDAAAARADLAALLSPQQQLAIKRLRLDGTLRLLTDAFLNENPTRVWATLPVELVVR